MIYPNTDEKDQTMKNSRTDRKPIHPGYVLRKEIMPAAGINEAQLAKAVGMSRRMIEAIVSEKRGVTPDIALRLAAYFGTGVDFWLRLQLQVDLWQAMKANRKAYADIKPLDGTAAKMVKMCVLWPGLVDPDRRPKA